MIKIVSGYETWSEIDLLTGVIIGEARGESTAGMIGVGLAVKTRADHPGWWGRNWREVALCDKQFSCWADLNAKVIKESYRLKAPLWKMCYSLAREIYTGIITDSIGGPTHYHAATIFPDWASGMKRLTAIGNHIFYRDTSQIGE